MTQEQENDEQNEDYENLVKEQADVIASFIEKYVTNRKDILFNFFNSTPGSSYLLAPGSSSTEYHDCHIGGLAKHSIQVFKNLMKMNKVFNGEYDSETILLVSLFHDIGKALNCDLEDFYVPEEEAWRRKKGFKYNYNHGSVYLTNNQRSVYLLGRLEIPVSPEEYQAILLNDGQYLESNKCYRQKETNLALLLHMADMMSTKQ